LEKSIEAYILSLETINRLSLMKAKLLHESSKKGSIYYKKVKGQRRRSISLRDCLIKTFVNEKDPVRLNIEHIANLRDEAVHLVISQVPGEIIGLFQACVLNYHRSLNEFTGISVSDRVTVGMMTIVYDFSPEEYDLKNSKMRKRIGREAVDYLTELQAAVQRDALTLDGNAAELSIDISYKLALVKSPNDSDIVLTTGTHGGTLTKVIEVPKDPSRTHPLRLKEVLKEITNSTRANLNSYDLYCVITAYSIKKRSEYYYKGAIPGSPSQYSQLFIEWMSAEFGKDPTFFGKARQKSSKTHFTKKSSVKKASSVPLQKAVTA
jgi:hypothetical protein